VRFDDPGIYVSGKTEIIGVDDEALQCLEDIA